MRLLLTALSEALHNVVTLVRVVAFARQNRAGILPDTLSSLYIISEHAPHFEAKQVITKFFHNFDPSSAI